VHILTLSSCRFLVPSPHAVGRGDSPSHKWQCQDPHIKAVFVLTHEASSLTCCLMRKTVFILLSALALGLMDWPAVSRASNLPLAPQPYTRVANPDTNTMQLQIALRKFVPVGKTGPTIWLAGVMHLGEPQYYNALQSFLDKQTVVLYEGINADAHPHHVHDPTNATVVATNAIAASRALGTNSDYSMQATLARSLGLVFQLEAIDYDRTNFLNSDLSIGEIQRIMTGPPGGPTRDSPTNASFDVLLQIMDGSSFLGSLVKMGLQYLAANPQMQAVAKMTLIEAIGKLKGDLSDVQGLPPDWQHLLQVLIQARNAHLLQDLRDELAKIPASGSVAVFYGAAHMDDMEKKLTSDFHYRAAEDVWLPAFSVDLRQTGMTPQQAQMMRKMVEGQIEQMQRKSN
jgi:hypothetical protein